MFNLSSVLLLHFVCRIVIAFILPLFKEVAEFYSKTIEDVQLNIGLHVATARPITQDCRVVLLF